MARQQGPIAADECNRCGAGIAEGKTLCECGKPTKFMSFADRNRFEVSQWRTHQDRMARAS